MGNPSRYIKRYNNRNFRYNIELIILTWILVDKSIDEFCIDCLFQLSACCVVYIGCIIDTNVIL